MNTPSAWTEDRVSTLRHLYGEGKLSAAQMAEFINHRHPGVDLTRNAVVGKLHRLHLVQPKAGGEPKVRPPRVRKPRPKGGHLPPLPKNAPPPPPFQPRVVNTAPLNLTILELHDGLCKYETSGTDEPAQFTFCGHPSLKGAPYCMPHAALAYLPVDERRHRRMSRAA